MADVYFQKPVKVEAIQFNGKNGIEISKWSDGEITFQARTNNLRMPNLNYAYEGDWLIKEPFGYYSVQTNDSFCRHFVQEFKT